jgi:hypothetical protein
MEIIGAQSNTVFVEAPARVRMAIEDILDEGLPRAYTPELY